MTSLLNESALRGELDLNCVCWLANNLLYTGTSIRSLCCHRELGRNDGGQVNDTLRIAPLVVIPHDNLDKVLTHDHGERSVNGVRIVSLHEVAGDQRLLFEIDDALHGTLGGSLHCCVDILLAALLADLDNEVNDGDIGSGHPQSNAVQLALVLGQDLSNSLGGTRGGGHDVAGACAGAAQVTVPSVKDHLVTSVRVRRCHHAVLNAKALVKDLADRGHAVGRARGIGDDGVILSVIVALIDTNHVRGAVLAWCSQHHLLRTSLQVLATTLEGVERSGGFNDHLDIHVLPGHRSWITAIHDLEDLAINRDLIISEGHLRIESTKHGVILEEVGSSLGAHGPHIDRNDVERLVRALQPATEHVAADAAETVDCSLCGRTCSHSSRSAHLLLASTP